MKVWPYKYWEDSRPQDVKCDTCGTVFVAPAPARDDESGDGGEPEASVSQVEAADEEEEEEEEEVEPFALVPPKANERVELEWPAYMTRPPSSKEVVEDEEIADVGGESDEEAGDSLLSEKDENKRRDGSIHAALVDLEAPVPQVVAADEEDVVFLKVVGPHDDRGPAGYVAKSPKTDRGEPAFEAVDNPMGAGQYVYRAVFDDKTKQYKHHALPTGATAVPARASDGKRVDGDWTFHYGRETDTGGDGLEGVTDENPFPESRKGMLDIELLKMMGLTADRMEDPLWWVQLLLPMCNPERSGIDGDPRMPFNHKRAVWTNKYATGFGLGATYGHSYKSSNAMEHVRMDGVYVKNGALGGNKGAIHRRWKLPTDRRPNS